jgi:hypothetical protein
MSVTIFDFDTLAFSQASNLPRHVIASGATTVEHYSIGWWLERRSGEHLKQIG